MYHPQRNFNRLYIIKMEGGRELLDTTDCIETEEQNIPQYLNQSEERLLRFSKSKRILSEYEGPVSTAKKQKKEYGQ